MKTYHLALPVLVALITEAAGVAQTTYTLTELVPPGAGFLTQPSSINSSGNVAMQTSNGPIPGTPWVMGPAGTIPLDTLPGDAGALPVTLFDNGRSAGGSGSSIDTLRPVVWSASGAITELRRPMGDSMGVVISGNGSPWLVGFTSAEYGVLDRPALWISRVLITLDVPSGFTYGAATDVNAAGRIVGVAWTPGMTAVEGWTRDGLASPVAIGQFPGQIGNQLNAVNNVGDAVGVSIDDAGVQSGLSLSAGSLSIFAPPSGYDLLDLVELNRAGQMIGFVNDSTGVNTLQAVIMEGQQVIPLEQLLDPVTGAGWLLLVAQEINNSGQIAVTGLSPSGNISAAVLTPSPSPLVGAPAWNRPVSRRSSLTEAERRLSARVLERSLTTWNLRSRLRPQALSR